MDVKKQFSKGRYVSFLGKSIHFEHGDSNLWGMLGYKNEDIIGRQNLYMESIFSSDCEKYVEYITTNARGGKFESCEYRMVKKDGSIIDVLDTMELVVDAEGNTHGYSTVMDITEDKNVPRVIDYVRMNKVELHDILKFSGIMSFKYNLKERYCPEFENLEVMHYTPESYWNTLCKLKAKNNTEGKYVGNLYYIVHKDDKDKIVEATDKLFKTGEIQTELRFLCGDEKYHWFSVKMYVSEEDKNIINGCMYSIDEKANKLSELEKSLENEKEDNDQMHILLNFAGLLYFEYDIHDNLYTRYKNLEEIMYYTPEEYNKKLDELTDVEDEYGRMLGGMYYFVHEEDKNIAKREAEILRHTGKLETELRFLCGDGEYHWFKLGLNTLKENDTIIGYMENIDSQIEEIKKLKQQTSIDPMTGVLNKVEAFNRIDNHLQKLAEPINALLVIDVDDFKLINDNFGHSVGDDVLVYLANSMGNIFRDSDIIARFGGDEFIVFMKNIKTRECVFKRAKEIQELCKKCTSLEDKDCELSVSIGIAFSEQDTEVTELFKEADDKLYKEKNVKKGNIELL